MEGSPGKGIDCLDGSINRLDPEISERSMGRQGATFGQSHRLECPSFVRIGFSFGVRWPTEGGVVSESSGALGHQGRVGVAEWLGRLGASFLLHSRALCRNHGSDDPPPAADGKTKSVWVLRRSSRRFG